MKNKFFVLKFLANVFSANFLNLFQNKIFVIKRLSNSSEKVLIFI